MSQLDNGVFRLRREAGGDSPRMHERGEKRPSGRDFPGDSGCGYQLYDGQ